MIDDNGGGQILLDEWCSFLKKIEIAASTSMGELLAAQQESVSGIKRIKGQPSTSQKPKYVNDAVIQYFEDSKKVNLKSSWVVNRSDRKDPKGFLKKGSGLATFNNSLAPSKSAEEVQESLKAWLDTRALFKSSVEPNSFGLSVGSTASDNVKNFISVFEPLAAETPEGDVLRDVSFLSADPNGKFFSRDHIFDSKMFINDRKRTLFACGT
jgi:hypothetical protein